MLTLLLLPLTCLMLSPSLAQEPPIPAHMLGKFQLETSEGFDDFMYEINVGWFTRKVSRNIIRAPWFTFKFEISDLNGHFDI